MRVLLLSLGLLSSSSLRVCSSEETSASARESGSVAASAGASVSGKTAVSANAKTAIPRIGGSVVAVGDHSVEVVLHQEGLVHALVLDATGQSVTDGVARLAVTPPKPAAAVQLRFSPALARFEGHAAEGMTLVPGRVDVSLDVEGKTSASFLADVPVLRGPELGGSLLVAGNYGAEVFANPSGEVLAFVRQRSGAALEGNAGLELSAKVSTTAGATETVGLSFDAARRGFVGKAKAALAPGPFELLVSGKAGLHVGRLERCSLRGLASHGGEVLVAGDYGVELVAAGQQLSAFVLDAHGRAASRADLKLTAQLPGAPSIALDWDASSRSYRGAFAANIDVDARPITLTLVAGARAFHARASSLRAVLNAKLDGTAKLTGAANADLAGKLENNANTKLDAKAKVAVPDVRANLAASAAKAKSAAASVTVTPPKVTVTKSASATTKAGTGAKASAGFRFGTK